MTRALTPLLFAVFWTAIVGFLDALVVGSMARQHAAASFPTTTGVITRSEVVRSTTFVDGRPRDRADPTVAYTYTVNGRTYTGDRLSYGRVAMSSEADAHRSLASFPIGASVPVHYNPADPADAALLVGNRPFHLFVTLFLTPFNLIMIGLWGSAVGALRRHLTNPPTGGVRIRGVPPVERVRPPTLGAMGMGLIAGVVVCFGATLVLLVLGLTASARTVHTALIVAAVAAAAATLWRHRRLNAGHADLLIDQPAATLRLPARFGRASVLTLPFDTIRAVDVLETTTTRLRHHHSGSGFSTTSRSTTTTSYEPSLILDQTDLGVRRERVARFADRARAEAFARWFAQRLDADYLGVTSPV